MWKGVFSVENKSNIKYSDRQNVERLLKLFDSGTLFYKDGRIYRTEKRVNQFKTVRLDIPQIASRKNSRGYRRLTYSFSKNDTHTFYEHRIIFALFYGVDELYRHECIDHIDGDKGNNKIENLRGLSIRKNTYYAEKLGNYKRTYGEINGQCKLTIEQIEEIRNLYKEGNSQYKIANIFNISQSHVSNIVNNKKRKYG